MILGIRQATTAAQQGDEAAGVPIRTESMEEREKPSISEGAYQHLRSRIFAGELPPGTLLTERRLADALGASRTPLRTAINRLEGEGLIERTAGGGFIVRRVALDELMEILSIRRLLVSEAAALAAERMPAAQVQALLTATPQIAANPQIDVEHYWTDDDTFHRDVARGSGKLLLARMIEELRGRARMCHVKTMDRQFAAQAAEHMDILQALAAHDGAGARHATEAHIDCVRARLLAWLARR